MEHEFRYQGKYVLLSCVVGGGFFVFGLLGIGIPLVGGRSDMDSEMFWGGLCIGLVCLGFAAFFFFRAWRLQTFRLIVTPEGFTLNNGPCVAWEVVEQVSEERLPKKHGEAHRLVIRYSGLPTSGVQRLRVTEEIDGYNELKSFLTGLPSWSSKMRTKLL